MKYNRGNKLVLWRRTENECCFCKFLFEVAVVMSIGYACLSVGVPGTDFKSCVMKNAGEERLRDVIAQNLSALENLIEYNIRNHIYLFRISSDIIPFGSSPVNSLAWWDLFEPSLTRIGARIHAAGMRVSMHPGQYTILNSPTQEVVARAVEDLRYHTRFLGALHTGPENKIILHIGGIYGNKDEAVQRFIDEYQKLDDDIKLRLVLENDERSYHICDVLDIARQIGAPAVFDNLHHAIHPCSVDLPDSDWIHACAGTWKDQDGRQKIHYSQQSPDKRRGAHTDSIRIDEFLSFYQNIHGGNIDIMLEVKDKNLSAVKCINCTTGAARMAYLELDWSRYKYLILEKAPGVYHQIRELLKDRDSYPAVEFYHLVEFALKEEAAKGNQINAALHVWGYFKKFASENEKKLCMRHLQKLETQKDDSAGFKRFLLRLAQKYDQKYLLDSLYFYL